MKIEENKKYNFDDVLIKPRPSELKSRSEVNLNVSYICKHSQALISGFPVIVANMSCVGTIPMAQSLYKHKTFVALHKFIEVERLVEFFNSPESEYTFYTLGMSEEELDKLKLIESKTKYLNKICLDTANGYMYSFLDRIKIIRGLYPNKIILAGNVATPEGVENIIKAGADLCKCGISNGCFIKRTKVKTRDGYKNIEKIKIGDEVMTHEGEYKRVIQTHQRFENQRIMDINGIKCTSNHKFYVVNKHDINKFNTDNIHKYAKWISASDLSDDYFLIKIT